MTPGTILFDHNFRFLDGQIGKKLFILLTDGRHGTYISAKTTSNGHYRGLQVGCQIGDKFPSFFLPKGCCCLTEHTWLCLEEFYEYRALSLYDKVNSGNIHRIGVLPDDMLIQVLRCTSACPDISNAQAEMLDELLAVIDLPN